MFSSCSGNKNHFFEIVIPVYECEHFLKRIIDYWKLIGEDPIYLYDSKSSDGTLDILKTNAVRFLYINKEFTHIEEIIYEAIRDLDSKWILRIDADEILTQEALAILRWETPRVKKTCAMISFPRQSVYLNNNLMGVLDAGPQVVNKCCCNLEWFGTLKHVQARLVDPSKCLPNYRLHSPGMFPKPGFNIEHFALDGYYHLDSVLNSQSTRESKLNFYLERDYEVTQAQRCYYLPERCLSFPYFTFIPRELLI